MSEPAWLTKARANGSIRETGVNLAALAGQTIQTSLLPLVRESEDQFQTRVIDLAHLFAWRVAHFRKVRIARKDGSVYWQTPVQADGAGFPDLLMTRGVWQIVAELKVGSNKPTAEQDAWLESFRAAGIPAYVWRPVDWLDIETVLRNGPPRPSKRSGSAVRRSE